MNITALAATCETTGQASAHTHTFNSQPTATGDDRADSPVPHIPRGDAGGGSLLLAADVLTGSTTPEYGTPIQGRQIPLFHDQRVSPVEYGDLVELAKTRINQVVHEDYHFDWDAFLAGHNLDWMAEEIRRRAAGKARRRGVDFLPSDIPLDTVLKTIQETIDLWTKHPEHRPSPEGRDQWIREKGNAGRAVATVRATRHKAIAAPMFAQGMTNAQVQRELQVSGIKVTRKTVGVWRKELDANVPPPALDGMHQAPPEQLPFPAPDIPPTERWPVVQLASQAGILLDAQDAHWLADLGRCYEAEGRADELMRHIRASAHADIDPWQYLLKCIHNRGDSWTIRAQLLADVLAWAGEDALKFALANAVRLLPYLKRTLATAVADGKRPTASPHVRAAINIARQCARVPDLVITDVDDAFTAEDDALQRDRAKFVDSYRRRFGRLPWETDDPLPAVTPDPNCYIGIRVTGDDSSGLKIINPEVRESSFPRDANVTKSPPTPSRPAVEPEKSEHPPPSPDLPEPDENRRPHSHAEALDPDQATITALPRENFPPQLEHRPCRHPLAGMLATTMDLADTFQVDCAYAGCGCRIYSDRGALSCPCHLTSAAAAALRRKLQAVPPKHRGSDS